MKRNLSVICAFILMGMLSAGCAYRVRTISNTAILLTPNVSEQTVEDHLKGTASDLYVHISCALEAYNAPASSAHSQNNGFELAPAHPSDFFKIFARKELFSKNYSILIVIKYDLLIEDGQINEKRVATFTDDLKLTLDDLDNGGEFRHQTKNALHLKLTSKYQSYDVVENVFEHLPLPVTMGLAKYSWRHDKTFTYFDVLPEMDLVLHKGVLNATRDTIIPTTVDFLNVSRQNGKFVLSSFFARFGGVLVETDPTRPRYATSGLDFHANYQASPTTTYNAKYLGMLYQGTFRAATSLLMSYCSCVDLKYQCNSLLIRDVNFENFSTTNRPAWDQYGNLAVPARILDHDHAIQYSSQQTERVVVDPYIFVFVKKDYIGQMLELGATYENWHQQFPSNKFKHLKRLYNGHYRGVKGDCKSVLINFHDKIK